MQLQDKISLSAETIAENGKYYWMEPLLIGHGESYEQCDKPFDKAEWAARKGCALVELVDPKTFDVINNGIFCCNEDWDSIKRRLEGM